MRESSTGWLDEIVAANRLFQRNIDTKRLPVERAPGQAVFTCMDPRVNLASIGITGFRDNGEGSSSTRIIRTLGGMADDRSLIVGIFLAGIREIVVLMHTDCGCCLAHSRMDLMVANMERKLSPQTYRAFRSDVGEPFEEKLRERVRTFADPGEGLEKEIDRIRRLPFAPRNLVLHGLLYELKSASIEVVVNGYHRET